MNPVATPGHANAATVSICRTFSAALVNGDGLGLADCIVPFISDGTALVLFNALAVPFDVTKTLEELVEAVTEGA